MCATKKPIWATKRLNCTFHIAYSTFHIAQCTLHIPHCTLHVAHCMYIAHMFFLSFFKGGVVKNNTNSLLLFLWHDQGSGKYNLKLKNYFFSLRAELKQNLFFLSCRDELRSNTKSVCFSGGHENTNLKVAYVTCQLVFRERNSNSCSKS